MSEAKHTPGPWQVGEPNRVSNQEVARGVRSDDDWVVCDVWADSPQMAVHADANARLIAAAPELLEKLVAARMQLPLAAASWNEDPAYAVHVDAVLALISDIDALIAKARGQA